MARLVPLARVLGQPLAELAPVLRAADEAVQGRQAEHPGHGVGRLGVRVRDHVAREVLPRGRLRAGARRGLRAPGLGLDLREGDHLRQIVGLRQRLGLHLGGRQQRVGGGAGRRDERLPRGIARGLRAARGRGIAGLGHLGARASQARHVAQGVDHVLAREVHLEQLWREHQRNLLAVRRGTEDLEAHRGSVRELHAAPGVELLRGARLALLVDHGEAELVLREGPHIGRRDGGQADGHATLDERLAAKNLHRPAGDVQLRGVVPVVPRLPRRRGVGVAPLQAAVAAEAALVRVQQHPQPLVPRMADAVVRVRVARVEVEHEKQVASFEDNDLVALVLLRAELLVRRQELEAVLEGAHQHVERLEELVLQVVLASEVEPTAAVLVAPPVRFRWEVHPLGMPELVAHEAQPAFAAEAHRDQPHHLVQREPAVDDHARRAHGAHVRVHLGVHEPERLGLVADDGLVVRLRVGDAGLLPAPVLQRVGDVAHVPIIVRRLLQELDPHVWERHR
mmetsp:Transcript_31485/g.82569  ORF Transcript_31485/g.82569 Transcript_31485/m.82569 type:complete len:509 (-) Transcript_31485:1316-2842(-)